MLLQAAGLALLAAVSPTALLIAAVYLGSARPRLAASFYLIGAISMSLVMGVAILEVLRSVNLSHPVNRTPRYDLRLGLGLLLLLGAVVVARRQPRTLDTEPARPGFIARMAASPAPRSAFLVGLLIFAPGAAFLAAIQVIATARASVELTILAVALVVIINVGLVWLPILLHVIAPDRTNQYLTAFNSWLRAHGQLILVAVLALAGVILIAIAIHGLTNG